MYLAAFWGAYTFFANWLAWARDPLKRGRDVAMVWRRAIDRARAEFEQSNGECNMSIIGIRQNPLNACVLQYQSEDGVWHDAADMSCCGGGGGGSGGCIGPLRVGTNGSIETSTDGGKTWHDTAPGITPTSEQNIPPAYVGDPEGRCKAANAYMGYVKDYLERILVAAGKSLTYGEFFLMCFDFLNVLFSAVIPVIEQLSAALQAIYAAEHITNENRLAAKDNALMICEFLKGYDANGGTDADHVKALETALRAAGDAESDEDIKWWWVHAADLVNIFGVAGAQKAPATYVPANPEDCGACEWHAVIDFTDTRGGFEPRIMTWGSWWPGQHGAGRWEAGTGWHTEPVGTPGVDIQNIALVILPIQGAHLTKVKGYAHVSIDGHTWGVDIGAGQFGLQGCADWNCGSWWTADIYGQVGDITREADNINWTGDVLTVQLKIEWNGGYIAGTDVACTKIELWGTGPIPTSLSAYIV